MCRHDRHLRERRRASCKPGGVHIWLTAFRMRLHVAFAGFGTSRSLRHFAHTPAPYAYRRLRAFASLSMARSGGYSEAVDSWRKGVYTSYTLS